MRLLPLLLLTALCLPQAAHARQARVESHIAVFDLASGLTRTVWVAPAHFEAPNWSPDGSYLILNSGGKLYRLPLEGGGPALIPTGDLDRLNNDHGISPDGKTLAVSNNDGHIYTLPLEGGAPTRITALTPSYWHGWSPDGRWLAYCAQRNDNFDIYRIPAAGGAPEERMTDHPSYDDGPDYSPDGKWIYFNSLRSGDWDIWRMPADGGEPEQMTRGPENDWFPHPSPDSRHIVFVTFEPGVEGHPANKRVRLRMMPYPGGEARTLVELFGGQGTINVPSWSPDSKQFAFVHYRLLGQ